MASSSGGDLSSPRRILSSLSKEHPESGVSPLEEREEEETAQLLLSWIKSQSELIGRIIDQQKTAATTAVADQEEHLPVVSEQIGITELLEEIQLLKEELQSKNQEIERTQNFVEKYKRLRQKVGLVLTFDRGRGRLRSKHRAY